MASDMPITNHFPMRKRRALGLGLEGRQEKRATTTEAKKRTEKTPEARTKISLRRNKKHSPSDKSCNQPSKTPTRAQFPNALVRLRKTPRRLAAWGGGYASDSGPEITWDNNSPSPTKALEKASGDGLLASKDPEQLASILKKLSKNKVLNKEGDTASNLFNSWMRRENTSGARRSERLIGKGRQKKRSVLNLAKPPEVAQDQRLTRKRSRAGTWNGVEFHKELSKFVENINEIGHEQHRPKTNDEAAPNKQPNNQDQNLDVENLLMDDCDIPLLVEDVNNAGNDRPSSLDSLCEENEKVAVVADYRIKLEGATDVDRNIVRDAARSVCSDVPFEGNDDLGDDIFIEIDELPKHNGKSHQKLSAVSTKYNITAKQELPRFGNEVSKSSSANDVSKSSSTNDGGNNRETRKNCSDSKAMPERSCQNGHRSTGNDTKFASSGSSAGKYVRPCKFTTSVQRLPVNSCANMREFPEDSYMNGKDFPNRNDLNGRSLPQYNDANGRNLIAGFSVDSSNCCTDGKGSLTAKAIHASNRASTNDAQSLSDGKKSIMNPSIKPAPKNMLKSVVAGKTHFTLGKTPKMIDSNVGNRSEKSSETKERTVKQSLQRNIDEKEKKVENLGDSLDLDCLGDLSLDKDFEDCLADGKQNTGSKSKIEVVPGNQTSFSTKKQHKEEVKVEGMKNIDDIDIEEWEEDIFIDDEDLSSGVRNGISSVTEAKGNKDVNINHVDDDLDEFLAFSFDEKDCKIVNGRASTNVNRPDNIKKAVQSKQNHENGNSCGNKITDNYVKNGEYDHINDMDCEFDDLDLSESCLQDLQLENDCKDSSMRNANAFYEGSETKFVKQSVSCNAAGFGHNIRKNVVHKMSLIPSSSTNVERVVDIRQMKKTHPAVAKKEHSVKSISSESFTNKVIDSKIRTNGNVEWDAKSEKKNSLRAKSNFASTEICFGKDTADNLDVMNFDFDEDDFVLIDDEFDSPLKTKDPGKRITRKDEAKRPLSESSRKFSNCNSNFGQPKRSVTTDFASEVKSGENLEDKAEEFCNDFADLLNDDFSEGCFDDLEQKADKCQPEKATLVRQNAIVDRWRGEKISKHSSKNMTSAEKGVNVISNSNETASGGTSCFVNNNCGRSTFGVPRMSLNVAKGELKSTESAACPSKAEASESATSSRSKFKFRRSAGIDFNNTAGNTKGNYHAKRPIADNATNTKNVTRTSMLPSNDLTHDKHKNLVIRNKTSPQLGNAQPLSDNPCISKKSQGVKTSNGMAIYDRKQILLTERPIQNAVGADLSMIAKGSRSSGEFVALDADDDFWDDVEIDSNLQAKPPVTSTQKLDTGAKENKNIDRSNVTQRYTMQDIEKKKAEAKRKLQQKMIKEKQDKALMRLMKNKR